MAIPKSRKLTVDERRDILALKKDDISLETVRNLFACFMGQEHPKFNTYDTFVLPKGALYPGIPDDNIETTVGRYIINLVALPEKFLRKFGYINEPLTKGKLEKIETEMGVMVLNDEMTTKEYSEYLDAGEWLGMGTAYYLSPTMNYEINLPIPEVIELRDQLFEKYKEGIKRGDSNVAKKIESEVLAKAREILEKSDNESYDFFKSGVGKFENNYKKTSIMAGAIENPYTKKLDIMKSNYIDGVDKKEYPNFTNLSIIGGFSRGVETQSSGYSRKKFGNAMQGITLDKEGSDCGTKFTMRITLPKELKGLFLYRYIVEAGKLVLLTEDNIDRYVGKEINLRSPMFCKGEHICSKCAGELFYKMGIKNAGLLNPDMTGVLLNKSMKKFHDATVKFSEIDISKYTKKR